MKKITGMVLLILISAAVLILSGGRQEHHTPEYYFRDNQTQRGSYLWAFCGNGTESYQTREFTEQYAKLRTWGVLPGLPEESLEISGTYESDGELSMIYIGFDSVQVFVYPPETEIWDSYYSVGLEDCTRTEICGISVYSDGTPEGEIKALVMTLADGTQCFIVGTNYARIADMVLLAEHFANNGLKLDAFSIERGDHYQYAGLEDPRLLEFAKGCFPPEQEIHKAVLELKNGEPQRVIFHYSLGVRNITWMILPDKHEPYDKPDMGDISGLSLEVLEEYFREKYSQAGFWCEDKYIYIMVVQNRMADELWSMIQTMQ